MSLKRLLDFEFKTVFAEYMAISLIVQELPPDLSNISVDDQTQTVLAYIHNHWMKARENVNKEAVVETFKQKCYSYNLPTNLTAPYIEQISQIMVQDPYVDYDWQSELHFLVADFLMTHRIDDCDTMDMASWLWDQL